jgi:hypothetical protein
MQVLEGVEAFFSEPVLDRIQENRKGSARAASVVSYSSNFPFMSTSSACSELDPFEQAEADWLCGSRCAK